METKGFTTGKWRWEQTAFVSATGALSAPYAVNYGVLGNTLLGTGLGLTNAQFSNWYYEGDKTYNRKSLTVEALKGGSGGLWGFYSGKLTTNYLSNRLIYNSTMTYTANGMREFSGYVGNTVGGGVSGVTPIAIDKSYEIYKE